MFTSLCVYPHMCVHACAYALCVCVCVCVNAQALGSAAPVTTPLGFPWSPLPHEAGPSPLPATEGWPYDRGTFGGTLSSCPGRLLVIYLSSTVSLLHSSAPRRNSTLIMNCPMHWSGLAVAVAVASRDFRPRRWGAQSSLPSRLLWASSAWSFLGHASFLPLLVHSLIHLFIHSIIYLSIKDSYTCQAEWVRDTCERE